MSIGRFQASEFILERILVRFDKTLVETTDSFMLSGLSHKIGGRMEHTREIGLGVRIRRTVSGFLVGLNKSHPIMII
jgi:hypothetical protein